MGLLSLFSRPKPEVIAPCDRQHPRKIMGERFLAGVEDIQRLLGIKYTDAERIELCKTLPSEKTLIEYKDKAYLFPGYSICVKDLEKIGVFNKIFSKKLSKSLDRSVSEDKILLRWYLVNTAIIKDAIGEKYPDQKNLLSDREKIPRVCELVYFLSIYKLMTSYFPIDFCGSASWLRSSDHGISEKEGKGFRFMIGNFGGKISKSLEIDEPFTNVSIVSLVK